MDTVRSLNRKALIKHNHKAITTNRQQQKPEAEKIYSPAGWCRVRHQSAARTETALIILIFKNILIQKHKFVWNKADTHRSNPKTHDSIGTHSRRRAASVEPCCRLPHLQTLWGSSQHLHLFMHRCCQQTCWRLSRRVSARRASWPTCDKHVKIPQRPRNL